MDCDGYIKLTDFGAAKYDHQTKHYKTFIGTIDFIPPEVLNKLPYDKSIDWWGLGIQIYQLLFGYLPFHSKNSKQIAKNILNNEVKFCEEDCEKNPLSPNLQDFIIRCLTKDATQRIGYNSDEELLKHPWFEDIETDKLFNYQINAPFIPEMDSEYDLNHFDRLLINTSPVLSEVTDDNILEDLEKYDPMFDGFYLNHFSEPPQDMPNILELSKGNSKILTTSFFFNDLKSTHERTKVGSAISIGSATKLSEKNHSFQNGLDKTETEASLNKHYAKKRDLVIDVGDVSVGNNLESGIDSKRFSISNGAFLKETDSRFDLSYSFSASGVRVFSPPQLSPGMGPKEGHSPRKYSPFCFDLFSPAILLEKENNQCGDNDEDSTKRVRKNTADSIEDRPVMNLELAEFDKNEDKKQCNSVSKMEFDDLAKKVSESTKSSKDTHNDVIV